MLKKQFKLLPKYWGRFMMGSTKLKGNNMVHPSVIEARLAKLNIKISSWFKAELRELQKTLADGEEIVALVTGRYYGGYALLVATNQRMLLIDKKTFFMAFEDIRYDMISEINFNSRLLDSTITLFTINKQHRFTCFKHRHQLRQLTSYVQQRVMQLRDGAPAQPTMLLGSALRQLPGAISHSTHRLIGSAAIHGLAWHNPYTNGPVMVRRQWSRAD